MIHKPACFQIGRESLPRGLSRSSLLDAWSSTHMKRRFPGQQTSIPTRKRNSVTKDMANMAIPLYTFVKVGEPYEKHFASDGT